MPHGLTIDDHDNVWLTDVALQQIYFDRPTGVAVAPNGSFYVSDGYRNTRVAKFSAEGRFLFQWGTKGSGPGQFDLPHSVALDSKGRVYVADRQSARIQIFDGTGRYLRQWSGDQLGRPYAIALDRTGNAYIADGGDQPDTPPDRSAWSVVSSDGSTLAHVGRYGNYDGQLEMAHSIALDTEGSVYVGDITGARVQKFVRSKRAVGK